MSGSRLSVLHVLTLQVNVAFDSISYLNKEIMWLAHDPWETVESFISCIGRDSTPSFAKILLCFTYLLLARIIDICKGTNILPFISSLMSKILLWCCYYYFPHISQEVCGTNSIRPLNSLPWPPARSAWCFHCLCRARTLPSPQLPKDLNYGTRAGAWPMAHTGPGLI